MMSKAAERQYDFWSRWYDRIWRRYADRTAAALLGWAQVAPESRVLDVGCGTGVLERKLLSHTPDQRIVGVDVSEGMLQRARERTKGVHVTYVRADAAHLPFANNTFDVVLSASAFHFFIDPLAACREMRRVLRTSGRAYITDWSRESPIMRMRDAVLRRIDPAHVRVYTSNEAARMLRAAGFNVVRTGGYRVGLFRMMLLEAAPEMSESRLPF